MNLPEILRIIYILSIVILLVGAIINLIYIIPLQIKQAKVKDGLAMLRSLMLMQGVLNSAVGMVSVTVLTLPLIFYGKDISAITVALVFIFALGFFTFTAIWVIMYRQQFTPKQKRLHAKIAIEEKKTQ